MTASRLGKNDFLDLVVDDFLSCHPPWSRVHRNRREYLAAVGRTLPGACFVWLSFSCSPNRHWFSHAVGWSPNEAAYVDRLGRRETAPIYPRDGSLRRLQTIESPRDFQHAEMSVTTFTLYRPFQDYDLDKTTPVAMKTLMLLEIEEYALPYLSLMLGARHGLPMSAAQIGAADGI